MIRKLVALALILTGTLYFFTGLMQLPTLLLAARGELPFSAAFLLFVTAPALMLQFGEPLPTTLFFLSAILSGCYLFLFFERIARAKATRLRYGLSGSLLSILSVGCVACGALLSPLAIGASIGVPLAIIGRAETLLGIAANVLLALGVFLLIKDRTAS
jgi:hypothetical protein